MKSFHIKAHITGYRGAILACWEDQFPLLIDCPIQQECSIVALAYVAIMQARISASKRYPSLQAITAICKPSDPDGRYCLI